MNFRKIFFFFIMCAFVFDPLFALAEDPLKVVGWIPYWKKDKGALSAMEHIDSFSEISPFGYTIKSDGTLFDAMDLKEEPWPTLFRVAKQNKVKIIPTVMSSNGYTIDKILRNKKLRDVHIKHIVKVVKENNFDGIDIDYEGKYFKTRDYFSIFLRDLYKAMGNKLVTCSIEAKMPVDSLSDAFPRPYKYANDLDAVNKYCDEVRIMTYDQGAIDSKLTKEAGGPYIPVSDPKWVEKVVTLMKKNISKKKIFVGVPTYGYEYEVKPLEEGYRYKLLWSFSQNYAEEILNKLNMTPSRNKSGELSFVYSSTTLAVVEGKLNTASLQMAPINSSHYSFEELIKTNGKFNIMWWSDSLAIKDKMSVAKKLGVKGVAVFKIDGGEDPKIWDVLKKNKYRD